MKPVVSLLFALFVSSAPFQCRTSEPPHSEDSAPEAMWNLAEHFHEQNMEDARRETLRRIVDQYPSSREANQAQLVLDGRELTPQTPRPTNTDAGASTQNATPAATSAAN